MLASTEQEGLFDTEQIQIFIDLIWQKYQEAMFNKIFIPFIIEFISVIIYFTYFLGDAYCGWYWQLMEVLFKFIIITNLVSLEALEFLQVRQEGLVNYIMDMWNMFDQLAFVGIIITITLHMLGSDLHTQKCFAAFSLFFLWIKLFYFMRIFDSTAAFIRMLSEIIKDCIPFAIFLAICVGAFANPLMLLD